MIPSWHIHTGDALAVLRSLPSDSVHTCVTSPPYWGLRDYGADGQIGLEETPEEYVARLVAVFAEVRRVLRPDGTLWLNLGDSYAHGGCGERDPQRWPKQSRNDHMPRHAKKRSRAQGAVDGKHHARGAGVTPDRRLSAPALKPKDLVGVPWMAAFALREDGWWLRMDVIWSKPNPMPESVTDRPTKAHEYVFLLSKSERYFYDAAAIAEPVAAASVERQRYGIDYTQRAYAAGATPQTGGQRPPDSEERKVRNRRSVWVVSPKPFPDAHFATFPPDLIEPCVLAGAPPGGIVLDPFNGAGTTGLVALSNGRSYVGIDINPAYVAMAERRLATVEPLLTRRSNPLEAA